MVDRIALGALALALAACGTRPQAPASREPESARKAPVPSTSPASPFVPRPAAPSEPGKPFPECDPRADDADREHVALGLLAGDCQDERGHNRVYVTRLVTVKGAAGPARRAGILAGDRVVRLDACEVISTHALASQLRRAIPGWVARVVVERGGRELEVFVPTVRLAARGGAAGEAHLSTSGCRAIGRKPARPDGN